MRGNNINIKFKNKSTTKTSSSNDTCRGVRSNFISCVCYDSENDDFVFVEDLDLRKRPIRFIPEFMLNIKE
jgi:hypothetical protein